MAPDPTSVAAAPVAVAGFDTFYAAHYRGVLGLAFVLTGDRAAAEELAQDAFCDAFRRWERVGKYDDPGAWVRRAVANRAISRLRRLGREAAALIRLAGRGSSAIGPMEPEDEAFWAAVRALPPRQAKAVALHYLDDLSVADVGRILGCSESAVKTHLHRGRRALAEALGLDAEEDYA
jgi:RNA polymerase sigma-70 factor (ECF subfamily)